MVEKARIRVVALRPFLHAPGQIARVGEAFEVDPDVARVAVAYGNARESAEAELETPPGTIDTRDPEVETRDPRTRRR